MGQTSHPYVERAKELLDESKIGVAAKSDGFSERCIARAQVNATLAVAAALHDLTTAVRSTQSSVATGDAPLTKEQ